MKREPTPRWLLGAPLVCYDVTMLSKDVSDPNESNSTSYTAVLQIVGLCMMQQLLVMALFNS